MPLQSSDSFELVVATNMARIRVGIQVERFYVSRQVALFDEIFLADGTAPVFGPPGVLLTNGLLIDESTELAGGAAARRSNARG